ncbi:hypothetical protein BCR36DRAFT_261791, partial [Piromyces finnis]
GKIINNEDEFIKNINNKEESLYIQDNIGINKTKNINITSQNFILIGNNVTTELHIKDIDFSFHEECESIEIQNITIIGNFRFLNNKNITFKNVNFIGKLTSYNNILDLKSTFYILNSNFSLPEEKSGYYFNNYNINIENSKFYGNNIYNLYLIEVLGNNKYFNTFNIKNTLFSGNYHNSGIISSYSNIACLNSRFENMFNGKLLNG